MQTYKRKELIVKCFDFSKGYGKEFVEQSDEGNFILKENGEKFTVNSDDWIVVYDQNEPYPVRRDVFEKTYSPIIAYKRYSLYKKKPLLIKAFDCSLGDFSCFVDGFNDNEQPFLKTFQGDMVVAKTDFIIFGFEGEKYPLSAENFHMLYNIASNNEE